ncbi:glycosomal ABC transporter member 1 [Trypanosoma conorhini]|uniref:Glycosomal ABC transporter member 1 n=1 Tax=Trypanosoma conorhini TaxID=83891 RepID=A0A3R7NB30_9TRYP|nr:glycosomal ABC transporter member 1 [Trypanosoma conorhini]RNF19345.1 glycosomal ABC transporter member 1 [Trypanosoma conorhini]
MSLLELCRDYVATRSKDWVLARTLACSLTALVLALALSPGRQVAKAIHARKALELLGRQRQRRRSFGMDLADRPRVPSYKRFLFLLRIAVPSLRSRESGTLMIISSLLLLHTYLTLRMLKMGTRLSRTVIGCDLAAMAKGIAAFLAWCLPTALTNSSLQYSLGILTLQLQSNLSRYFYRSYLNQRVFFPLAGSHSVEEVDQRMTKDIEGWSLALAKLYTKLIKPMIDVGIFSYKLASLSGARSPLVIAGYYTGFAAVAYACAPDFEGIVSEQFARNGALVTAHQRLVPFAEEYVMTQGEHFHRSLMSRYLASIIEHEQWASYVRGGYSLVERFVLRYGAVLLGSAVGAAAVFNKRTEGMCTADLMAVFVETSYLVRKLSLSIGSILENLKNCLRLQALTNRVYELQEGIEQAIEDGAGAGAGEVVRGSYIEFDRVPIVLPTNEVLCEELSFYVKRGMNLLVVGPNGCGKSSMVRLLGELWPLQSGRIMKPRSDQIYYLPQRPYMSSGTLRDQITYPLKGSEVLVGESTLLHCLELAMLDDIFAKPNITWDSALSWAGDTLSMGEKQKLAMARLFFHRPSFAILDECSSMMDVEVEERLYNVCHELGISLITIAHRRSVWSHHNWILRFDGCGGFMFSPASFEAEGVVVLTKIATASDPAMVGREVRLDLSHYGG